VGSGLMGIIEDRLLQGETDNMYIRPELYKLNIYGNFCRDVSTVASCLTSCIHPEKDSFFKAHKDTPRGTDMLGSLVVIYPTAHEGGSSSSATRTMSGRLTPTP
jgi:hypothetical protein